MHNASDWAMILRCESIGGHLLSEDDCYDLATLLDGLAAPRATPLPSAPREAGALWPPCDYCHTKDGERCTCGPVREAGAIQSGGETYQTEAGDTHQHEWNDEGICSACDVCIESTVHPGWRGAFDALRDSCVEHFGFLPGDYDAIYAKALRSEHAAM